MNVKRNRIEEIREEFAEILIDRVRCFHRGKTADLETDEYVNRAICELGRVLALLLRDGGDKTEDSHDEARYRCNRVNCRNRC